MITRIYYVFRPSKALVDGANEIGNTWILDSEVWIDEVYDRTGRAHTEEEVLNAFWVLFLSKLTPPNLGKEKQFIEKCKAWKFEGCWTFEVITDGGSVSDAIEEAREQGLIP